MLTAAKLRTSLVTQPAPWFVTALGTVVSLVAALLHMSPAASAVLFSIATAVGTIITAAMTRPVAVSVISGACAVVLGDLAIFGLHLNSDEIGAIVALISFALGAFLHLAHVRYVSGRAAALDPLVPPLAPPATSARAPYEVTQPVPPPL